MDTQEAGVEINDSGAPLNTEVNKSDASADNWKALYEKEKEKAENYKRAFTQKKEFVKAAKEETDEDEDRPISRKEFRSLLREEVVPMVASSKEDTLLEKKVSDPEKRRLVKFYLENRIVRTGTNDEALSQDIDFAISAADGQTAVKENSELKRALDNRPPSYATNGSSADRGIDKKPYGWTPEQALELEKKAVKLKVDPEKFKKSAWENRSKTTIAMG